MPRCLEVQSAIQIGAEAWNHAVEVTGEVGLCEQKFQLAHDVVRICDLVGVFAQPFGELAQNAVDLSPFLFLQPHQFVIQVDGFHRLDKQCMAAGRGRVNHALNAPALSGDDRHHETLVADGDELFLQRALFTVHAKKPLQ